MEKIISNCNNHQCSKCGSCCTISIPITRKEEFRIKKYIKENNVKPEELFDDCNFYAMCCFFDRKNHKCKIYPVRPEICKTFKCDRNINELEKERLLNNNKAYWNRSDKNGIMRNITTFDLLFYDNPRPLVELLIRLIPGKNDEKKFAKVINVLKEGNQEELANCLHPVYEEENEKS